MIKERMRRRAVLLHELVGRTIDGVFPPTVGKDEIETWDRYWDNRLKAVKETGRIYEHHTPGKRWLYEQITETIKQTAGTSLDGKTVAELGSGSGYASLRLAEHGIRPILIDGSQAAIRYSQYIAEYLGVKRHATFLCTPLLTNVPMGPYDMTFNSGVLEHYSLDVAKSMLRQMIAATRPGGTVLVILPNLLSPVLLARMIRSRTKGSERFYTSWLLRHLMREEGLSDIRSGFINALLPVETPIKILKKTTKLRVEKWAGYLSALFFCSGRVS